MIGSLIDEMLANAQEHYETIQEAKGRPLCLRDKSVYGCRLMRSGVIHIVLGKMRERGLQVFGEKGREQIAYARGSTRSL